MCGYCYADAKPSKREMTYEDFHSITDGFKTLRKRLHNIDIYGENLPYVKDQIIYRTTELFYDADCMDIALKNKKGRKLVVRWNTVKGAKGYQLQYALSKKFKKKKSIQTKKTKYIIKKLKKKKTYYIRVRAYKMDGKKKVYGKWSKVKKIKVQK